MTARSLAIFALTVATAPAAVAQFTAGNFAAVRVGDGATTLNNAGFQPSVFQFDSTLQTVNAGGTASVYSAGASTAITTVATGTAGLQLSGSATSDGHLSRSGDGSTLTFGGYSNTAGVASIGSSANRSVARVTAAGTATVQVITGGPFGTGNFRAAASIDGTQVWMTGNATGVVTGSPAAAANADLTTATSTNTNNRAVGIYGTTNSLFFSAAAGTQGVYAVNPGSAASTATGQTATNIIAVTGAQGFWMADRDATANYAGTGLDTAYVIGAAIGQINKYEFDGTNWVARGTATIAGPTAASGFITGDVIAGSVKLYGVFDNSTGLSNNTLYSTTDSSAFGANVTLSGTLTLSAGTNYAFRGVSLVPVPEPASVLAVCGLAVGGLMAARRRGAAV